MVTGNGAQRALATLSLRYPPFLVLNVHGGRSGERSEKRLLATPYADFMNVDKGRQADGDLARANAKLPAGKQQRFLAPLLYKLLPSGGTVGGTACTAVNSGHNNDSDADPGIGYPAVAGGFSAVTGLGIPNGQKLLATLTLVG